MLEDKGIGPGLVARVLLLGLLLPNSAEAEKGALSLDVAVGPQSTLLSPPLPPAESDALQVSVAPGISLSARYSLTHDLSLGLSFSGEPWRRVVHDGTVWVGEAGEDPLLGRFVHSYAAFSVSCVARFYLAGYDWRFFVEPQVGWSRRMHKNLDHLRVEEGRLASYGLALEALSTNDLTVGTGLGMEYVWDRVAVGLRGLAELVNGNDRAYRARLLLHAAYDFYP